MKDLIPVAALGLSCRVTLIATLVSALGCGTSQECVERPSQVLLQSVFTELGVNAVAPFSFRVPADLDSPGGAETSVQWTPQDNSTLLVVSDHPCPLEQVKAGACSPGAVTGQAGSAYTYPSLAPRVSYIVYVLNLGPQVESGRVLVRALGGRPEHCYIPIL